jgi:hypothetical protein
MAAVKCQACDNCNAPRVGVDLRGEVRARVGFAIWCGGALQPHEGVEAGERELGWRETLDTTFMNISTRSTFSTVMLIPIGL